MQPAPKPTNLPSGAAMDRPISRSRAARLRRWGMALLGVVAVIAAAAAIIRLPGAGTLSVAGAMLVTGVVAEAAFQDYLPVRASAAPLHTVYVGAIEGGQVASVSVAEGVLLRTGDLLASLSNPQLQLDVTSREASIASQLGAMSAQRLSLQQALTTQDTAIADAAYALLKAQRDLGIHTRLHAASYESDAGLKSFADEAHYEASRLALLQGARARDRSVADAQFREIDETGVRLRGNLAVVETSLQALSLRAPVAGRLTNFSLQPGQSLNKGDRIGQIDSEGAWRLDADVDEFYLGRVAAGQHAIAEIGDAVVPMTVSAVRPQVTAGMFRAEMVFAASVPAGLRRGQSIACRITLGATRPALVAPNGAWVEAGGGSIAFVLDPDGRHARRRVIATGRRNPDQIEVTAGLQPGDRLVTSSYRAFADFGVLNVN